MAGTAKGNQIPVDWIFSTSKVKPGAGGNLLLTSSPWLNALEPKTNLASDACWICFFVHRNVYNSFQVTDKMRRHQLHQQQHHQAPHLQVVSGPSGLRAAVRFQLGHSLPQLPLDLGTLGAFQAGFLRTTPHQSTTSSKQGAAHRSRARGKDESATEDDVIRPAISCVAFEPFREARRVA